MTTLNLEAPDGGPLFFGPDLGIQEYTDPRYPELERLAMLQRSQFWTETEIDMSKDVEQWVTLDKDIQDISILNLTYQIMADTMLGRSPFKSILPNVSNNEFEGMLIQWGTFENLHSRAYSHIIRTVFPDPKAVIRQVKTNQSAYSRLNVLRGALDSLEHLDTSSMREKKLQVFQSMIAIYGLESMQFYNSFACTFALAEQDILNGIADNLKLIAKDEAIHTHMSLAVINIMKDDYEYDSVVDQALSEGNLMLDAIRTTESSWGKYLFSDNRQMLGMNAGVLEENNSFVAYNAYSAIGMDVKFDHVKSNPIPWIDKYLDPSLMQIAPQERQITNYRVGSTDGDMGDLSKLEF